MFFHVQSGTVLESHSAVRSAFPNVGFESTIDASALDFLGVVEVLRDPRPAVAAGEVAVAMPPELAGESWVSRWEIRQATPEEVEGQREHVARLVAQVDEEVARKIANSTRFALEYQEREAAAITFRDSGYVGDPTVWISRFASNKGISDQAACDIILSQAAALRAALRDLAALRMDKYLVQDAPTIDQAEQVAAKILADVAAVVIP